MDSNPITVCVRILSEQGIDHCLHIKNRNNLHLIQTPEVLPSVGIDKCDKSIPSPSHQVLTPIRAISPFKYSSKSHLSSHHKRNRSTPSSVRKFKETITDYDLDYIFYNSDSLDYIYETHQFDIQKNVCMISLGRSGTLTDSRGMIFRAMEYMFSYGYSVRMSCMSFSTQKHMHYFDNEMVSLPNLLTGIQLFNSTEYFNSPKEPLVITSFIIEKENVKKRVQFVDFSSISSMTHLLIDALTNCDRGQLGNDKTLQVLSKTLCYDSKIYLLGNILPTVGHYSTTSAILNLLKKVITNRPNNNTLYSQLLHREIQKCDKKHKSLRKENQELVLNTDSLKSEIINLNKEKELLMDRIHPRELEHLKINHEILLSDYNNKDKELSNIKISYKELQTSYNQLLMASQVPTIPHHELQKKIQEQDNTIQELTLINKSLAAYLETIQMKLTGVEQTTQTNQLKFSVVKLKTETIATNQEVKDQSPLKDKTINHKDYYDLLKASWIYSDQMHEGLLTQINRHKQLTDFKVRTQMAKQELLKARLKRTQQIHSSALFQLEERDNICLSLQEQFNQLREKYLTRSDTYKKEFEAFKEEAKSKIKQLKESLKAKDNDIKSLNDRLEEATEALQQFKTKHVKFTEEMKQMSLHYDTVRKETIITFEQEKIRLVQNYENQLEEERRDFSEKESALRELLISKNKKKAK